MFKVSSAILLSLLLLSVNHLNSPSISKATIIKRAPAAKVKEEVNEFTSLTDIDKIKIFLGIYREIPEIFVGSASYDFDLLDLLDDQLALQTFLRKKPDFLKLWGEKIFLEMSFSIQNHEKDAIQTTQMSSKALSDWKIKLKQNAEIIIKSHQNVDDLTKRHLVTFNKSSSVGILNGLILSLPPEFQKTARLFQKNNDLFGIEAHLREHLPAEVTTLRIEGVDKIYTKAAGLEMWKTLLENEASAGFHMDLSLLMHNRNQTLAELIEQIASFTQSDFDIVSDKDFQKNGLKEVLGQNEVAIPNYYQKHLQVFSRQTEVVETIIADGHKLRIIEKNPFLAILRGFLAGDCGTQKSFPYPNDPNERIFFIFDEEGHPKGNISSTMVLNESGEKVLYVHTISGSRINTVDTNLILQGLYKNREALGVKSIVLPTESKIPGLLNFSTVRSVYLDAIANKKEMSITYQNQEIRKIIEETKSAYNSSQYDHMKNNTSGVEYIPSKENILTVKSDLKKSPAQFNLSFMAEEIDPLAYLEFTYSTFYRGYSHFTNKMNIAIYGREKAQQIDDMIELMGGGPEEALPPLKEVDEKIEHFFKNFQIDLKDLPAFKERYLQASYFEAPDAFSGPNYSSSMKVLMRDFRFSSPNPLFVRGHVYKRWGSEMLKSESFDRLKLPYLAELQKEGLTLEKLFDDQARFLLVIKKLPPHFEIPQRNWFLLSQIDSDNEYLAERALGYVLNHGSYEDLSNYVKNVFRYSLTKKELIDKLAEKVLITKRPSVETFNSSYDYHSLLLTFTKILMQKKVEGDDEMAARFFKKILEKEDIVSVFDLCLIERRDGKWSLIHKIAEKFKKDLIEKKEHNWSAALRELSLGTGPKEKPQTCLEAVYKIILNKKTVFYNPVLVKKIPIK